MNRFMVTKEFVLAGAIASAVLAIWLMFSVWYAGRNVVASEQVSTSPVVLVPSVPRCDGGDVYMHWSIDTGTLYSCDAVNWTPPVMVERAQ